LPRGRDRAQRRGLRATPALDGHEDGEHVAGRSDLQAGAARVEAGADREAATCLARRGGDRVLPDRPRTGVLARRRGDVLDGDPDEPGESEIPERPDPVGPAPPEHPDHQPPVRSLHHLIQSTMTDAFANLVSPVFLYVIDLLHRLEAGENPALEPE